MSYERLIAEHAEIDEALVLLQKLVATCAVDIGAVVVALSDLSQALARHLAHEDSFIYPRMIAGQNAETSAVARQFVRSFEALRQDWELYLAEWNSECIAADWDNFRCETERMATRLAQRVRAENELLYATALRTNVIPLRERRGTFAA